MCWTCSPRSGALVEDGGSYHKPAVQPNPEDVIDMSDRHRDRIVWQRDHDRFCDYAADLVSVALWNGSTQTLAGLADRALVPETDVRATLEWAERQNLLHVTGSLDATFTMTLWQHVRARMGRVGCPFVADRPKGYPWMSLVPSFLD
jgi:hypothetical protein